MPVKLGELHDDGWSVDTLYVTATAGQEDGLEQLSNRWNADQVDWIGGEEACRLLGVSPPAGRIRVKSSAFGGTDFQSGR